MTKDNVGDSHISRLSDREFERVLVDAVEKQRLLDATAAKLREAFSRYKLEAVGG